jgi:hypothetical protein
MEVFYKSLMTDNEGDKEMFLANIKMKQKIIDALIAHADGNIKKHVANINIFLENPAGVGEHEDLLGTIVKEVKKISDNEEVISVLKKYF